MKTVLTFVVAFVLLTLFGSLVWSASVLTVGLVAGWLTGNLSMVFMAATIACAALLHTARWFWVRRSNILWTTAVTLAAALSTLLTLWYVCHSSLVNQPRVPPVMFPVDRIISGAIIAACFICYCLSFHPRLNERQ